MPPVRWLSDLFFVLTALAFVASALQAYLVWSRNPTGTENRLFGLLGVTIASWSFGLLGMATVPPEALERARLWFRISAASWAVVLPLVLHLMIALTGANRSRPWRVFRNAMYAFAPVLTYFTVVDMRVVRDVRYGSEGWVFVGSPGTFWPLLNDAFMVLCVVPAVYLVWRRRWRSPNELHRKQARIILASILLALVAFFTLVWGREALGGPDAPNLEHLVLWLWIFGVGVAISRYGLMMLTPAAVATNTLTLMTDAFLLLDRNGAILSANRAAANLLGWDERRLTTMQVAEVVSKAAFESIQESAVRRGPLHDRETTCRRSDGTEVPVSVSAVLIPDRPDQQGGVVLLMRDISERKKAEEQLHFLATHDLLTRLPNRVILQDRFKQVAARARRNRTRAAVLMIDLDGFKRVNDEMGHEAGDLLLQTVAQRLARSIRECDTIVRLGGDEFVLVLTDLADEKGAEIVVHRLQDALAVEIPIRTKTVRVGASIGISMFPADGDNIEELLKCADQALYRVKETGKGGYCFYGTVRQLHVSENEPIEVQLRRALEAGEFELHYQPVYEMQTGVLSSLEALVRWRHPTRGLVPPLQFISAAEKSGQIVPLGEWVLATACRQVREWRLAGRPDLRVAVNVSARQFLHPEFVAAFDRILAEAGVEGSALEIEITESTAMQDVERSAALLGQIRARGALVVIDDFGLGYSSLN